MMLEDKEIIEMYKAGRDEYAFRLIMHKYKERLYWHIRSMCSSNQDADDILQNTFIKVWRFLPTFRGDARLYTWLYRIATNDAVTYLNRKRITSIFTLSAFEGAGGNLPADEDTFNGNELQAALHREILKLPPRQRAVFTLRYFRECKFSEIAEMLSRSEGAVKASYHHAYTKIKEKLLEEF